MTIIEKGTKWPKKVRSDQNGTEWPKHRRYELTKKVRSWKERSCKGTNWPESVWVPAFLIVCVSASARLDIHCPCVGIKPLNIYGHISTKMQKLSHLIHYIIFILALAIWRFSLDISEQCIMNYFLSC